jgi:hypothetical protein
MNASALIIRVYRMEMLGVEPQDIYSELSKTVAPHLAWRIVHAVTGWAKRRPKSAKPPKERFGPQARANMSAGQMGKRHAQATCDKIAKTLTGKPRSEETRKRIADGRIKYWAARRAEKLQFSSR